MRAQSVLLAFAFILGACVPAVAPPVTVEAVETPAALRETTPESTQAEGSELRINVRVDDTNSYNFPQLIPPDGIRPVYDPTFAPASQVELQDEELILGVAIQGQAKAYPITVLRHREMVNDELAGIPMLVTW